MSSEPLQFIVIFGVFVIVAVLWLAIIYLPGRTMENWRGERHRKGREDHKDYRDRDDRGD